MIQHTLDERPDLDAAHDFFPAAYESACWADYLLACRSQPEEQLPPYSEWKAEWLMDTLRDEADACYLDALDEAMETNAVEQLRRAPMPVAMDDEVPF